MAKLAINGGPPIRTKPFSAYITVGSEEKEAVSRIIDSGVLSRYLGCWHENFYGGPEVQALEAEWAEYFGIKHAIAVNSCTSGLYCAVGASGIEPGEEIIVSPYTMCASATAPLIYNAIPVFADIEEDYFCLNPKSVEQCITSRTRAIIAVDIFGLPYDADNINDIAKKHNLIVIEDCAQAPGARYGKQFAGTIGDIGVFSLNYHKHIHCGEGGVVVTNDDKLAEKVRLIRNHAEAVVEAKGVDEITNMIGFNFRMTEVEAAIARCQLQKLANLLRIRQQNCKYLAEKLSAIPALIPTSIRQACTHAYYIQPFKYKEDLAGVSRNSLIEAVKAELPVTTLREAEGTLIGTGYCKPLYLLPLFQKKTAYGTEGYPFSAADPDYSKGICPVAERMYEKELWTHDLMHSLMTENELEDVIKAFFKVWENKDQLH